MLLLLCKYLCRTEITYFLYEKWIITRNVLMRLFDLNFLFDKFIYCYMYSIFDLLSSAETMWILILQWINVQYTQTSNLYILYSLRIFKHDLDLFMSVRTSIQIVFLGSVSISSQRRCTVLVAAIICFRIYFSFLSKIIHKKILISSSLDFVFFSFKYKI